MSIKLGTFHFSPSTLPTLTVAFLLVVFLCLGTWQLNRADEKRAMLKDFERSARQSPAELILPVEEPENWRYRKVSISGRFDHDRQFLLDNQVNRGQVGVNVMTPLKLQYQQQAVLVDRGWLPLSRNRANLPDIDVTSKPVNLTGRVYVPYKKAFHLGELDEEDRFGWPRLVQYLDFEELSDRLGYAVAPLTIRLDPSSPYGYRRNWPTAPPISPDTHTAYAMQWFTLAGVSVIIYIALGLKKTEMREHHDA